MGRIRLGLSSWTDQSLIDSGKFDPPDVTSAEDRLRFYAAAFPGLVEVNSTYYGLPSERNSLLWVQRTPDDFLFDVKMFSLLTHHPTTVRSLPRDLYEAAYIDGAKRSRIYYGIVLPLIKPALATVAIYNLVPIWNDLWFPLIFITQENQKTVLLAVTRLQGQYATDWPKVFALLTLSALPVIILYLTMSKQFVAGLTAGAVKG